MFDVVSAPFVSTVSYLLVADYRQRNFYQLRPDTGELRSILTNRNALAVNGLASDPYLRIIYSLSREKLTDGTSNYKYFIRKQSLDGKINTIIYTAQSCKHITAERSTVEVMWSGKRKVCTAAECSLFNR